MKPFQRVLLGSAAGLVAVSGAQAADLPVKARPVEYVKICSLYGEGYYYIPGTDTCLKWGGYARADYGWNVAGSMTPAYSGTQGAQDRSVAQYATRHRANFTADARTQTPYGTLRTLLSIHIENVSAFNTAGTVNPVLSRALIQWAGFTFGHAQSYQDTFAINDSWHYLQQQNNSDTAANGTNQIAYTWELGNGMTLTLGADESRRKSLANLTPGSTIIVGAEPTTDVQGQKWPDVHLDFKVDQVWGYWATSVVGHDVSAQYYVAPRTPIAPIVCSGPGPTGAPIGDPITSCGHPDDKIGWAIQTGGEFKLPWLGPGDRFGWGVRYAVGASGYGAGTNVSTASLFGSGNFLAFGAITDGVFINGSDIELTTSWTLQGAYEHGWTPNFKTSWYGSYTRISYNDTAKGFFLTNVCNTVAATNPGINTIVGNCNPDWSFIQVGSRTQWTPVPGFILGVDVGYVRILTAFDGSTANLAGVSVAGSGAITAVTRVSGARPAGVYTFDDQGIWSAVFRAQRNFNAE